MLSKGTIIQPLASQIFQRAAAIRLVLCGRVTPASEVEQSCYCCLPAERERLIRLEMGIHECHMQLFGEGKKTKFVFIMIQPWKWKLNPGVKRPSPSTAPRAVRNTTRQRARSRSRKAKDRVNSSVVSYFTCIPRLKISIIHLLLLASSNRKCISQRWPALFWLGD